MRTTGQTTTVYAEITGDALRGNVCNFIIASETLFFSQMHLRLKSLLLIQHVLQRI